MTQAWHTSERGTSPRHVYSKHKNWARCYRSPRSDRGLGAGLTFTPFPFGETSYRSNRWTGLTVRPDQVVTVELRRSEFSVAGVTSSVLGGVGETTVSSFLAGSFCSVSIGRKCRLLRRSVVPFSVLTTYDLVVPAVAATVPAVPHVCSLSLRIKIFSPGSSGRRGWCDARISW